MTASTSPEECIINMSSIKSVCWRWSQDNYFNEILRSNDLSQDQLNTAICDLVAEARDNQRFKQSLDAIRSLQLALFLEKKTWPSLNRNLWIKSIRRRPYINDRFSIWSGVLSKSHTDYFWNSGSGCLPDIYHVHFTCRGTRYVGTEWLCCLLLPPSNRNCSRW